MAKAAQETVDLFKKVATTAGSTVVEVNTMQEAMDYALGLCEKKEMREIISVGEGPICGAGVPEGETLTKVLVAPGLDDALFTSLEAAGTKKGFTVIKSGLRKYLSGTDVGFAIARMGIAETASCVMDSVDEDQRLATMLCEISVLALRKSTLAARPHECAQQITDLLAKDPAYVSFISAPSKTSDIERVLTLGVHGPLELHVALVEE